eukprot:473116_1
MPRKGKRGNGWISRKSGKSYGKTANRTPKKARSLQYNAKMKLKKRLKKEIKISNDAEIQQEVEMLRIDNDNLRDVIDVMGDNTHQLLDQLHDIKLAQQHNDPTYQPPHSMNEQQQLAQKFEILNIISVISPDQLLYTVVTHLDTISLAKHFINSISLQK